MIKMIRTSSNRFRHPRPIDSWEGVKETKNLPNSCIQVTWDENMYQEKKNPLW